MNETNKRLSTGISGLDEVLKGGLIKKRTYLVRGGPGTGKTTLGFHYLIEGAEKNEKSIFITLTESKDKMREDAQNRGFDLNNIEFVDLSPSSKFIEENKNYDVFPSNEVDQKPLIDEIIKRIKNNKPNRVFFDGLTQLRYLSSDSFQFRKQILSLVQFAVEQNITLLISSEASINSPDDDLQFMCDGVINLENDENRRVINISKFRGSGFLSGRHSMKIKKDGIKVYPKLRLQKRKKDYKTETISAGVPEIDELLHGGLERGTTTVLSGASGVGKTTLGLQFMKEASGRGERSVIYAFEEGVETILNRSEAINIPIKEMVKRNTLAIEKIDPLEYTPDEFTHKVKREVEENNIKIVMIDSVSGYKLAFERLADGNNEMVRNLHALTEYLTGMGVTVLLINEIQNITGDFKVTELGISYMADNIIFLRYLEMNSELRKAIGVLKKRLSDFENKMRQFKITKYGIKVGSPLTQLRGILTGNPEFIDSSGNGENFHGNR